MKPFLNTWCSVKWRKKSSHGSCVLNEEADTELLILRKSAKQNWDFPS